MKYRILMAALSCMSFTIMAQPNLYCKNVQVSFFSKAVLENISAVNNKAVCVWELASGKIECGVLIKGFEFQKALMQEHFNEDYLESDQYPKAFFKGIVENSSSISLKEDHTIKVNVSGELILHGVIQPVHTTAIVTVKAGRVSAAVQFSVLLADYHIKIPAMAAGHIGNSIEIKLMVPEFQVMASH